MKAIRSQSLWFTVTTVVEMATGGGMLVIPSTLTTLLLGNSLDFHAAAFVPRIFGAILISVAVLCWRSRHRTESTGARRLAQGMTLYNLSVVVAVLYAFLKLNLFGIGLWPAAVYHSAMVAWWLRAFISARKVTQATEIIN